MKNIISKSIIKYGYLFSFLYDNTKQKNWLKKTDGENKEYTKYIDVVSKSNKTDEEKVVIYEKLNSGYNESIEKRELSNKQIEYF